MQKLRSFLRSCFAYFACIYLIASFGTIPALLRTHEGAANDPSDGSVSSIAATLLIGLSYFFFLIPPLLSAVFGAAWWTLKRGTPSARRWALAASAAMVLSALPMLPAGWSIWKWEQGGLGGVALTIFLLTVASVGGGIAGLYAFSRKHDTAGEAPQRQPRVSGDGTHWIFDGLFWGIQIVGIWWIISVYMRWGNAQHFPSAQGIGSWIQWFLVILAVILIHESAHAVVGIAVGMKLRSFRVGPFEYRHEMGRWKFQFHPSRILCFSGAAGIVSPEPEKGRWNEVAAIAAAPFANLLSGAVAAAFAFTAPGSSWEPWWEYLALFAAVSIAMCVSNLVPIQTASFYSDGAHIYQLLFSRGPAADFARANRSVLATLVSPRRPRDYDIDATRRAKLHFSSGARSMVLHLWARDWCIDTGNLREAAQELAQAERVYDESPAGIPLELLHSIVIYEALLNRNAERVRKYWGPIAGANTRQSSFYWLAKCAFHWAENNGAAALEAFRRGLDHLSSLPDVGDNRFDRDQFRAMEEMLAGSSSDATGLISEPAFLQSRTDWPRAEA